MPNWCNNSLLIEGDDARLRDFLSLVHGEYQPLSFNKIIPEPEDLKGKDDDGPQTSSGQTIEAVLGMPEWYRWRCHNWGTKWDVDVDEAFGIDLTLFPGRIEMFFNTAWAPSLPATEKVADQFPELRFDHIFSEEGGGNSGRAIWHNGGVRLLREYSVGSKEHESIARGTRFEEAQFQVVDWLDDIPINNGLRALGKDYGQQEDLLIPMPKENPGENRQEKLDFVLNKFESCKVICREVATEAFSRAETMGFPLSAWKNGGLGSLPTNWMWGGISFKAGLLAPDGRAPRIVRHCSRKNVAGWDGLALEAEENRGGSKNGDLAFGRVRFLSHGFEVHLASGWSVCCLVKDGEKGYVITKYKNEPTDWTDGVASCQEFSQCAKSGQVFKSGEAHCVDGKLWDLNKNTPAIQLWYPNGQLRFAGRFFNGKNASNTGEATAVHYDERGKVLAQRNRKTRALAKKTSKVPPAPKCHNPIL